VFLLFAFWLGYDQEIVALEAPHDDGWFLKKARCGYWFDEGYSNLSLIKEPVYPLFVGLTSWLNLPLRQVTGAVYLAAAGFFSWSLVRRQKGVAAGLIVFAACALQPMSYHSFERVTSSALYPALLLATSGALVLQVKLQGEPGSWRRGLASGILLGLLWNTRPERLVVLGLVGFFLLASASRVWSGRLRLGAGLWAWVKAWALPLGIGGAMILAVRGANFARWGVFATTDLDAPGFNAAMRALLQIKPEHPLRHVAIPREARQRAYSVSPHFRELEPFLDGPIGAAWTSTLALFVQVPPGEIHTACFFWALRDATAAAGHCQSARDAESYYRQVAAELNAAAAAGRLPTRAVPPLPGLYLMDPCLETYLPHLLPCWNNLWTICFSGIVPPEGVDQPGFDDPNQQGDNLYDVVAHRRWPVRPHPPTVQAKIRTWISWAFGRVMPTVIVGAAVIAAALLLLRRAVPAWKGYFLVAGALAVVGFARLGLLSIVSASLFPNGPGEYLFPAALVLTALIVWCFAKGLGLFAEMLGAPIPAVPEAGSGQLTRRRLYAIAALSLTGAAVMAVSFYRAYAPAEVPVFATPFEKITWTGLAARAIGTLDVADDVVLSGWAWDPKKGGQPVSVDIYNGDDFLVTILANEFRADLVREGFGAGTHGFTYPTPERLKDGRPHLIRALITGTTVQLDGTPKVVTLTKAP
jgi:hypothetical protein